MQKLLSTKLPSQKLSQKDLAEIFAPRYQLLQIFQKISDKRALTHDEQYMFDRLIPGVSSEEKAKRLDRLQQRWTTEKLQADMEMVVLFLSPDKKPLKAWQDSHNKIELLDLSFLDFSNFPILFEQSFDFKVPISFLHSIFGELYFQWSRFQRKVNFKAALFRDKVKFLDSTFENIANFEFSHFVKKSEFSGIAFRDRAAFNFAVFDNYVSFKGSSFHALLMDEAYFSILPNFRYTLFDKTLRFHSVHIPSPKESIQQDNLRTTHSNKDQERRNKSYEDKYRSLKEIALNSNDHLREQEFFGFELASKWLFKEYKDRFWLFSFLPLLIWFYYFLPLQLMPLVVGPLFFSCLTYLPILMILEKHITTWWQKKRQPQQEHTTNTNKNSLAFFSSNYWGKIRKEFVEISYLYLLQIYGLFSYYGQSLARPFLCFLLLPYIFLFSYYPPNKDITITDALHFSYLNMIPGNSILRFNHIEYLKEKIFGLTAVMDNFNAMQVSYPLVINLSLDAVINLQEILSLLFLFLIGLALRNRFRIE